MYGIMEKTIKDLKNLIGSLNTSLTNSLMNSNTNINNTITNNTTTLNNSLTLATVPKIINVDFTSLLSGANSYTVISSNLNLGGINCIEVNNQNLDSVVYLPAYDPTFENTKIVVENYNSEALNLDLGGTQYEILAVNSDTEQCVSLTFYYLGGSVAIL